MVKMRSAFAFTGMAALLAACLAFSEGRSSGPFETKLPVDRQIVHLLNRLTFGPRPGDVENVRRMGVEKWIELQLHPERIPENPALAEMLRPLATLTLSPTQVAQQYAQGMVMRMSTPVNLLTLLSQDDRRNVLNGTAEERAAVLTALDSEKRKQVLLQLPPTNLESLPEFRKEAEEARKAQQEERRAEMRRQNPTLMDLLTSEQRMVVGRGTPAQLKELFDQLEPEKRVQVAAMLPQQQMTEFPELRREGMMRRMPQQVVLSDLRSGKLYRAVYSDRQLEEVLTDFWLNHFNVFEGKNVQLAGNAYRAVLADYELNAIRPHVLGHFKDLLLAVAKHPAMLYYLDNWESMSTDTQDKMRIGPFGRPFGSPPQVIQNQQPHGLNENFGRELMELHTLGAGGGYTQQDVIEVARCFTGWTVRRPEDPQYVFVDFMHDDDGKTVLGHKIAPGGGEKDGLQVIEILARHPSTAKFISRQLAQRFVADDPPQVLVDRMAATFLKTDGDLRAVMQTMISSPEFLSEGAWQAKIKSPFELVVSALRAIGATSFDGFLMAQKVADLGEPLYGKVDPNGYPLTGEGWLGTTDLLGRMNFAATLTSGQFPGLKMDPTRWDGKDSAAIARDLLGRDAAPATLRAIADGLQGNQSQSKVLAGLILGSPEFNRR